MKPILLSLFTLVLSLTFAANKTYFGINEKGEKIFQIEAKYVSEYSGGLALIKQQNLVNNTWITGYGYINTKGELVIPCEYADGKDFVDNRAWVKKKDSKYWTLINEKGEVIPTKNYEKVGYIMEGYSDRIAVYENGKMGWIDRDGKEVIPCKYLGSSTFDKEFGLACVTLYDSQEEKYGFIDKNGAMVIPFQFKQAGTSSFHNGFCRASVGGKTVLINDKGEVVFTPKYGSLQNINHGLMAVATKPNRKGWGFINMENEMVIPAIYDHVSSFNEDGFAYVERDEKVGLIDTTGKEILPCKYDNIYCDVTEDGYICAVHLTEEPQSLLKTPKDYYNKNLEPINLNGATLMSAKGGSIIPFMTSDAKRGFMNRDFEIIIPAKYTKATAFHDGVALVLE